MHDEVKKEVVEDCNWLLEMKKQLACCWDCADSFKKEAEAVMSGGGDELVPSSSASRLPSWLQQYKDEKRKQLISINQVRFQLFSNIYIYKPFYLFLRRI